MSLNFFVEIKEGCNSSGMMWSSMVRMYRLHVCIDWMGRPVDRVVIIRIIIAFTLEAGSSSTQKWYVDPDLKIIPYIVSLIMLPL